MELTWPKYKTIMIIEDNRIDLYIATKIITKNNFAETIINYDCAFDAFRYIQSIKQEKDLPEVIFIDINLGQTSGFDFVDLFLTLPRLKTKYMKLYVVSSTIDTKDLDKIKSYEIEIGFKEKYIDENFLNSI